MSEKQVCNFVSHCFDYAANRYYCIEIKNYGIIKGILLNYCGGRIILLTERGIVHLNYSEIHNMFPLKTPELNKITNESYAALLEEMNNLHKGEYQYE